MKSMIDGSDQFFEVVAWLQGFIPNEAHLAALL